MKKIKFQFSLNTNHPEFKAKYKIFKDYLKQFMKELKNGEISGLEYQEKELKNGMMQGQFLIDETKSLSERKLF